MKFSFKYIYEANWSKYVILIYKYVLYVGGISLNLDDVWVVVLYNSYIWSKMYKFVGLLLINVLLLCTVSIIYLCMFVSIIINSFYTLL